MTSVFIPAMSLLIVVFLGLLGLRRFSVAVRLIFNVTFFLAISIFFWTLDIFPMFAPLSASDDSRALWLRAIGGAWWILAARVTVTVAWFSLHRDERSREARLFSDLFAGAVYIATAAVILNSVFALPLTGVVATSGVVAIVLGLALQSTLADVFAGIAVGVEAPFGVGDRVQIGDATEGEVVQMNWRSIHVQTDGDDVAVIPNSVVSKAYILNRSFPSHRRTASVDIACPEGVSPERAIETLLHSTKLCPGILPDPPVTAMLVQLGPTNTFRVSFSIEETKNLASTRDILLRAARRQMYYAGLFDKDHAPLSPTRSTGDMTVRRRLLRDIVLFESLADKQIDQLGKSLEAVRLEPGDIVFSQGEVDAYLYMISSGIVELSRLRGTNAEIIGCIGAGEYLGEIGMLSGAPHVTTAVACTHCQLYRLHGAALGTLMKENLELGFAFEKSVRRGKELLGREIAVRASPPIGEKGQLLSKIRSLFQFPD